ncbi:MAG: restriction endonuclease subunit S [Planctomycetes bacterium]|nr:restriction endonuclease subunit S [Planctomycetota bacterium]
MSSRLSDENVFELISGLWTGERQPLMRAKVLRATNFRGDGVIDFEDVVTLDVEQRFEAARRLRSSDIIIERSGGGVNQPVGRAAIFVPPDDAPYFTSNFTTGIRIKDRSRYEPRFVAHFLNALYLSGATETLQRKPTGIRNLDWQEYLRFEIPSMELGCQNAIADILDAVRSATRMQSRQVEHAQCLQSAAMNQLFTRGLRGQPQKETVIGLIPETWDVVRLGSLGRIGNGSTPKKSVREYWEGGTFPWLNSAKVYDRDIVAADAHVTPLALKECHLPVLKPGAVLVAITGQGKTLGHCAVLRMEATINQHFAYLQPDLYQTNPRYVAGYLETQYENLRQVASGGGSTKGALTCAYLRDLQIPMPPTKDEQDEIAEVIDAIDRKIDLHQRKRAVLEELFKSLLHKLMTGEVHVADLDLSALPAPMPQEAHS